MVWRKSQTDVRPQLIWIQNAATFWIVQLFGIVISFKSLIFIASHFGRVSKHGYGMQNYLFEWYLTLEEVWSFLGIIE